MIQRNPESFRKYYEIRFIFQENSEIRKPVRGWIQYGLQSKRIIDYVTS